MQSLHLTGLEALHILQDDPNSKQEIVMQPLTRQATEADLDLRDDDRQRKKRYRDEYIGVISIVRGGA